MRNTKADRASGNLDQMLDRVWQKSPLTQLDVVAGIGGTCVFRQSRSRNNNQEVTDTSRQFLVASLTKPVMATLAMQYVCEGRIGLSDRVADFLPAFRSGRFRRITIQHLLTHTSGLPDMLPENESLRAEHAPLSEFVARTSRVHPEFDVATNTRYSSMGFAVLGQVLQQVGRAELHSLLTQTFLDPLQIRSTWLGLPEDRPELLESVLQNELPQWQPADADWNWNSRYWRQLGAPWGGLITTADDLAQLSMAILAPHTLGSSHPPINPLGVTNALQNQLQNFPDIPESIRRCRSWGYGWRHNWPSHSACFCELLPSNAAGHWGATGTLWWLDPQSGRWAVLLSTTPYEVSRSTLQRISNVIAAALVDNVS